MKTRIILADDHVLLRQALSRVLATEEKFEVIGEASNGREVVTMSKELSPDLIIMDVGMPELNGVDATYQITTQFPEIKIIALSMHKDKQYVLSMLEAGASGYLLKDSLIDEMLNAINDVMAGNAYLSKDITNLVIEGYRQKLKDDTESSGNSLSSREREILQLVAEGKSSKEIAPILFISRKTVDNHRNNIMKKLDLHNLAELTKYAIRHGLTDA